MKHYLHAFILFVGLMFGPGVKAQTNIVDSLSLVSLFFGTSGANWNSNLNWLTGPVSTWHGITTFNNRVVSIDLSSNNLQGSIPAAIEDISMLSYINLSDNVLSGALPSGIANLSMLTRLDLSHNQLIGKLPEAWSSLSNLRELYLHNNQLTDTIHSSILHMDSLYQIYVNNNHFTELPDINSNTITHIYVNDNMLTFEDFFNNLNMAPNQSIAPQAKVGKSLDTLLDEGSSISFNTSLYEHNSEYQWYKDGQKLQGETNSHIVLSNILIEDTGTYYCEITNTVVQSLTLWTNSKRVQLKAIALVEVQKACSDESILLNKTDLSNYTQNVQSYNWDLNNDGVYDDAFGDSIIVNFNVAGLQTIGAQIVLSGGQKISSRIDVDIKPSPIADFSVSAVCAGTPIQAMNHSSVASGSLTYLWRMDQDTSFYSPDHANYVFNNGGPKLIKLVCISDQGCMDSSYYNLSIHNKPEASFDNSNACENKEVYFENRSTISSDTIVGVSWIFSSSVQSVATNPYHTFSSAGAHEVKLVVVSDKGCSDSLTTIIDVNALPDASIFAYPSNKVCAGDSIELSAYAGYDNYYWSNEDSLSKTMVASSGTYDVLIITNNNCMSKGIIEVEVLDDFVLNVSPDTTISLGDEIEIFADGASNYQWSPPWTLDDPYISSPVAKPWSTKQYQVIGVDDNGCADTANITVAVNRDYRIEPYNLITPNGDGKNDVWFVENIEAYQEDCVIDIYDRRGNHIVNLSQYQNDWNAMRDGKPLPSDTYYYTIRCNGHSELINGDLTILRQ